MIDLPRFFAEARGSVAVVAGLAITALVLGAGIAVDYGTAVSKRSALQSIADSAAIGAAREMTIATADTAQIEAVANNFVSAGTKAAGSSLTIAVTVDHKNASVEVALKEFWKPLFGQLVTDSITPIEVGAVAKIASSGRVCVVGLEDSQGRTIHLKRDAVLTANGCGVYSNSTNSRSIHVENDASLSASLICSAGGADGMFSAYNPAPTIDCPVLEDPLSSREPPAVGLCDFTELEVSDTRTLSPGVYCNNLAIIGNATLTPGIYIIKEGSLIVSGKGALKGENVGFYFTGINPSTGKASNLIFGSGSTISLTAPKDGEMAGLLMFEDRNQPDSTPFRITSNDARLLLGTVYLPRGNLIIDANAPVADQSAYTAIIARQLQLDAGPNLVLNSDYGATDIPIASGLSGVGGHIVLAR